MKVGEENFHMEETISTKPLRQENQSHLKNYQRPVGLSNENEEGISHVAEEGGSEAVGDPESYGKDFELHTQKTSKL